MRKKQGIFLHCEQKQKHKGKLTKCLILFGLLHGYDNLKKGEMGTMILLH